MTEMMPYCAFEEGFVSVCEKASRVEDAWKDVEMWTVPWVNVRDASSALVQRMSQLACSE